jgi:hypothetical protein
LSTKLWCGEKNKAGVKMYARLTLSLGKDNGPERPVKKARPVFLIDIAILPPYRALVFIAEHYSGYLRTLPSASRLYIRICSLYLSYSGGDFLNQRRENFQIVTVS